MKARSLCVLIVVSLLAVGACGTQPVTTGRSAAPAVSSSPRPSFVPPRMPPANVSPMSGSSIATVSFSGLPSGSYPVHLHARCSGSPGFHIAVIGFLAVAADGQGAISVPAHDFDRGWCLIVYGSSAQQGVLTTRGI